MNEAKIIYFAYGCNMYSKQISKRIRIVKKLCTAFIENWKFEYDGGEKEDWQNMPVGNIVKSRGDIVWGVLYELTAADLKHLDSFEHVPRDYVHTEITVETEEGMSVSTVAYTRMPRKFGKPSKNYQDILVKGALENNLPKEYIEKYLVDDKSRLI